MFDAFVFRHPCVICACVSLARAVLRDRFSVLERPLHVRGYGRRRSVAHFRRFVREATGGWRRWKEPIRCARTGAERLLAPIREGGRDL
eukprot:5784313-Pleurochrysis_carterae.AAC.1